MQSTVKAIIGLSVLALVSAAAHDGAAHLSCPRGYAPFDEFCMSAAKGDIVLPMSKKTDASAQASAGR